MKRSFLYGLVAATFAFLMLVTIGAFAQPATTDFQMVSAASAAATDAAPALVAVEPSASAPVIVNADGSFNFVPLVDGILKLVGAAFAIVATWIMGQATPFLQRWLGLHIDAKEAAKDLNIAKYADEAAKEVLNFARQQTGLTDADLKHVDLRNPFLATAAGLLFKLDPKVWQWVSNQETNVMKWLESKLPATAALPKTIVQGVGPVPAGSAAAASAAPAPAAAQPAA